MPELPEVETFKRTLRELVIGKTIANVIVRWPKIIKLPADVEEFCHLLQQQTITDVKRRGKFLIFELTDYALVSHLRMEGKYALYNAGNEYDKHTHVVFQFTDDTELWYNDVRKFGTMHLFPKGKERLELPLNQLGPEPLSDEFTEKEFMQKLKKTERKIKVVLLDQTIVAGLGNIYVDEALFRAKINPNQPANTLLRNEISALYQSIRETLAEAVAKGGSTVRSYVNTQGEIGMFQLELNVYGRKGEHCYHCSSIIEKTVVGGRGTHFCTTCQPLRKRKPKKG